VKNPFVVCAFSRRGLFFGRKFLNNILPCMHFPAGAFFVEKKRFAKESDNKIKKNVEIVKDR